MPGKDAEKPQVSVGMVMSVIRQLSELVKSYNGEWDRQNERFQGRCEGYETAVRILRSELSRAMAKARQQQCDKQRTWTIPPSWDEWP